MSDQNNPNQGHPDPDGKTWWLDKPENIRLIVWSLVVICIALVIADFLYHKHGHFDFEMWPAFYAWYGFLSYCFIVLSAKQIRKLIGRKETYYDAEDSDLNNEIDNDSANKDAALNGADNDKP